MICHNDDALRGAKTLSKLPNNIWDVTRRVCNVTRYTARFSNCSGSCVALGYIYVRILIRSDTPKRSAGLAAGMIKLATIRVDVLHGSHLAVTVKQWHDQSTIARDSSAVRLDLFLDQIRMISCGLGSLRPDLIDNVRDVIAH